MGADAVDGHGIYSFHVPMYFNDSDDFHHSRVSGVIRLRYKIFIAESVNVEFKV